MQVLCAKSEHDFPDRSLNRLRNCLQADSEREKRTDVDGSAKSSSNDQLDDRVNVSSV
jgi:hypothetical protein